MKKQCAKCNFTLSIDKRIEDGVLGGRDSLCSHTSRTNRGQSPRGLGPLCLYMTSYPTRALRVGRNLCLRGWRTGILVSYPCEPRHQREEEHLRVLILSSLESPLLAPRAQQICKDAVRAFTNLVRLNRSFGFELTRVIKPMVLFF